MFAEFEMIVYEKTEKGEGLTADDFETCYTKNLSEILGNRNGIDEEESYTWARIPHFYYNFYVYQYATGFAASEVFPKKLKPKENLQSKII